MPKGEQFVLHIKAPHGNPYHGHTIGAVIADLEKLTGVAVRRIYGDNFSLLLRRFENLLRVLLSMLYHRGTTLHFA